MQKFLIVALLALTPKLFAQASGAVELGDRSAHYPIVWPAAMDQNSVPLWARSQKIRFARWDGGRIETAKAFLSGWPGLNPPDPDVAYTMTNWYDLDTIPLLKKAHINLIWVTFSTGFSIKTEAAHQVEVRRYIAACHRNGIHVMAYESVANIFWEDMFKEEPASKKWLQLKNAKPIPYGAAQYDKMGRTTRYMANVSNSEWQAYLMRRLDFAIDAGADGIIYDNNASDSLFDLYLKIRAHAAARKHDFLIMANFHHDTYALNRLLNCITTEDGREPGLWDTSTAGYKSIKEEWPYLQKVGNRYLVNNFGLLSIHETLSDGWKPTMIEDGTREGPTRLEAFMSPAREKLALAENMTFGIPLEQYIESYPGNELYNGDSKARTVWQAVAAYNEFFIKHDDLYTGARSSAPLAIILDNRSEGVPLLDGLAARRVQFEVLYESDITPQELSRYHAVALLTAQTVHTSSLNALEQFVKNGGQLLAARNAGTLTETGATRPQPAFFSAGKLEEGSASMVENNAPIDQLAKTLQDISGKQRVLLEAPAGVLYNVSEQKSRLRTLIHVLNYRPEEIPVVTLEVRGHYDHISLVSPDADSRLIIHHETEAGYTKLEIDHLSIYSLIVLSRSKQ